MSNYQTVRRAWSLYGQKGTMGQLEKEAAVRQLSDSGLFSSRQLMAISGLTFRQVSAIAKKRTSEGGRFNPDSLGPILDIYHSQHRSEHDVFLYLKAVEPGGDDVFAPTTSALMVARLLGMPRRTVSDYVRKARALRAAQKAVNE